MNPILRLRNPIYEYEYLMDPGASPPPNMAVDGLGANKEYSFSPPSNVIWAIEGLVIFIVDPGTTGPTNFGSLPLLTNGVKIEARSDANVRQITNLKDNIDVTTRFPFDRYTSQTLDTLGNPIGWLNRVDFYVGTMRFARPLRLLNMQGDYIKAIVRDNLTGLEFFRMMYIGVREFK